MLRESVVEMNMGDEQCSAAAQYPNGIFKLKQQHLIGSTKYETDWRDKCGIYLGSCSFPICGWKCKRKVKFRFTELGNQ